MAKLIPVEKDADDIYNFLAGKGAIIVVSLRCRKRGTPVILVDTHFIVWLSLDQTQVSKKARAAVDSRLMSRRMRRLLESVADSRRVMSEMANPSPFRRASSFLA